jgi:hypothetical protein
VAIKKFENDLNEKKSARLRGVKITSHNSGSLPYCKVKLRRLRITLQYSKRAAARCLQLFWQQRQKNGALRIKKR